MPVAAARAAAAVGGGADGDADNGRQQPQPQRRRLQEEGQQQLLHTGEGVKADGCAEARPLGRLLSDGGSGGQRRRRQGRRQQAVMPPAAPDLTAGPDEGADADYVLVGEARRQAVSFFASGSNVEVPGGPVPFSSITFVLNVCGRTNPVQPKDLEPYWFGDVSDGPTLSQFFETCSHGARTFSRERNLVVGPLDVPCAAVPSTGRPFNSSRCTDRELFGWADWAMAAALQANPGLLLQQRSQRRVFLLPDLPACGGWESLASLGCGRSCPVFLKLRDGATPRWVASQLMHDLSHTLSMGHSAALPGALGPGAPGGPRGDGTCPLGGAAEGAGGGSSGGGGGGGAGSGGGLVCPNAANGWKVGWTGPLEGTDLSGLPPGFVGALRLPPTGRDRAAVARLVVGADRKPAGHPSAGRDSTFYVSYRLEAGAYDTGLPAALAGQVYVHEYDGSTTQDGTVYQPLLVGSSAAAASDGGGGTSGAAVQVPLGAGATAFFRLQLVAADADGATVFVCSSAGGPLPSNEGVDSCEECYDGMDNDCNGYADDADEYCLTHCYYR
ncbi:hypothetical protein GPECTOR_4g665 [Gonium pectorale]|uniref:Peptidase M11 gametolysin domain-containing protein n=1 Tax=Gonium pectorale TaxID=33097 RepID=A0A150GZ38_GONPE|nr:hypothetical protein GPECTOR_4g665 [Gonium pectorale]|eukprot:KXZ54600.1 hypothetical protein GPECTOR_4g665 [Gonium pectorale]